MKYFVSLKYIWFIIYKLKKYMYSFLYNMFHILNIELPPVYP